MVDAQFLSEAPVWNLISIVSGIGHHAGRLWPKCVVLRLLSRKLEDTMLHIPRPTPTCTRFQTTIEMPCIKCSERMRLLLIEPRDRNFNLLTYRCVGCNADEIFLKAI
jgi:hypothetical protein